MLPELRVILFNALRSVGRNYSCHVHFVEAPQDQSHPYIVFSHVAGSVRWDTMNKDDEQYVQINGYGKDLSILDTIKEEIRSLLDNQPTHLTIDTYTVYDISEQLNRVAKLGDVWQFTLQFKITIQKT
jgi:hypothetical protein